MTVRWVVSASLDFEKISIYLHENRPAIAQETLVRLYNGINSLGDSPYKGTSYGTKGLRRLVFSDDPYIAIYRIQENVIHVLRIRHTSRKPLHY